MNADTEATNADRLDEECPQCERVEDCECGQVFRYRVVDVWGDVPDWLRAMLTDDSKTIVDGWRGSETTWEIYDFGNGDPKPKYGWAGDYVGTLAAAVVETETGGEA